MKLLSPDRGENLVGLQRKCHRAAPQYAASISVLGENREGLHEQGCQRSAQHQLLLDSVLGENLEGDDDHHPEELECTTVCCWSKAGEKTVGTSTNCSTTCVSRRTAREGHIDEEILGTLITCSATGRSMRRKNSSALSTICGIGASRICTYGTSNLRQRWPDPAVYDTSMNTAMSVWIDQMTICSMSVFRNRNSPVIPRPLHKSATKEIDNVANRADQ